MTYTPLQKYGYTPVSVPWTLSDLSSNAFAFYNFNAGVTDAGAGAVSEWTDVLGNSSRTLSQATGSNRPILTGDGVTFTRANNQFLWNTSPFMLNSVNGVIVMAILSAPPATVSVSEWILCEASSLSTNPNIVILGKDVNTGDLGKTTQAIRNDANSNIISYGVNTNSAEAFDNTFKLIWNRFSKITNQITSSVNGVQGASPQSFTLTGTFTLDRFSLGALVRATNLNYANLTLKGLAILDASLSTDNIQRSEGYLAHLYSQTSLLPANHPYKNNPPMK